MADTLFTLLDMDPVDDFRAVLARFIEKTNPHVHEWWQHPVPETIQLHFCVANTPQKLHDYYTHLHAGTLDAWLVDNPIPQTPAEGVGQRLTWVRAKTLLHRMDRERTVPPVTETAPVTEEQPAQRLIPSHKPRFMPEGRRLPSRFMRPSSEECASSVPARLS